MTANISDGQSFFKAYEEHSKVLRTWLVAYGIGAPVVFLTNETVSKLVLGSQNSQCIAGSFLVGVALQVILAAINKHTMWILYYGETDEPFQESYWYKIANWISDRILIDFFVDLLSFVLFAYATLLMYETVISKH